jgi:hypothetical protein
MHGTRGEGGCLFVQGQGKCRRRFRQGTVAAGYQAPEAMLFLQLYELVADVTRRRKPCFFLQLYELVADVTRRRKPCFYCSFMNSLRTLPGAVSHAFLQLYELVADGLNKPANLSTL